MDKCVLIIGASSDIAIEIAKSFSKKNYFLYLLTRNVDNISKLSEFNENNSKIINFDSNNYKELDNVTNLLNPIPSKIIIANGYMGNEILKNSFDQNIIKIFNVNFLNNVFIINKLINFYLNKNTKVNISVFTSVAGLRGRAKNFIYGSSKSAMITFISGLRQKYVNSNINFTTIILGFVNTKMLRNERDINKFLISDTSLVAKKIVSAIEQNKEFYFPLKWRLIMFLINLIPEKIFKKLKF